VAPDVDLTEQRLKTFMELPWILPVSILLEISDEDLDLLEAAGDADEYWRILNQIVKRIEEKERR
jgi:hypothetical protein